MIELLHKPYLKPLFSLILLFIGFNFLYQGVWESFNRMGIDFDAYYHWEKYIGVYPPFWWLFMAPWRLLPYTLAKNIWIGFNLVILFFLAFSILRWVKHQQVWDKSFNFWLTGIFLISILYFYPLIVTLQTGQVNLLLLFLLVLSFWSYSRDKKTFAAIVLGITISLKPLPALLLIYWILKKEYRLTGIAIATILILWLITIPIFGIQNQSLYFSSTQHFSESLYTNPQQLNNTSLYAFWCETGSTIFHNSMLGRIFFFCSAGLLGIVWIFTILRNRPVTPIEYAWTAATPPILIIYTEMHHFILSLLMYLIGIGLWFKIKKPVAKIGLVISWVLVNLGFQIGDVTNIGQTSYLYRYLSLFGILIGWIAILIVLYQKDKPQSSA